MLLSVLEDQLHRVEEVRHVLLETVPQSLASYTGSTTISLLMMSKYPSHLIFTFSILETCRKKLTLLASQNWYLNATTWFGFGFKIK